MVQTYTIRAGDGTVTVQVPEMDMGRLAQLEARIGMLEEQVFWQSKDVCKWIWQQDGPDQWTTTCGQLLDYTKLFGERPKEVLVEELSLSWNFCPYCGKALGITSQEVTTK